MNVFGIASLMKRDCVRRTLYRGASGTEPSVSCTAEDPICEVDSLRVELLSLRSLHADVKNTLTAREAEIKSLTTALMAERDDKQRVERSKNALREAGASFDLYIVVRRQAG